jgi:Holliday junction DNA helicase RuvA
MISHISGILDHIEGNRVVIDVEGVGYAADVSNSFFTKSPKIGGKVKLYTCQVVREDSISLYGFVSKEERSLFSTLLSVSGIGPKGALALISEIPLDKLVAAITRGDVTFISRVKGIGSKTAQRLIVELKEKVAKAYAIEPSKVSSGLPKEDSSLKDAISALMTLGYSPSEARQAVEQCGIDLSVSPSIEDVIKASLKALV